MPTAQEIPVKQLKLDLRNFRMLPQPDEKSSVHAMIVIEPNKFWGLLDSLISSGYLPTDNIIVLRNGKGQFIVKEGNRRVACMKLIHKLISDPRISLPSASAKAIADLSKDWIKKEAALPCVVYEVEDSAVVDRIVSLAHGKGETASRDSWKSVARARHNRDMLNRSEPALDLLEKYLRRGSNCSKDNADLWGGDFNLTVLDEALKRLAPLLGEKNGPALATNYPKIQQLKVVDQILWDIGMEQVKFTVMRADKDYFMTNYGLVDPAAAGKGSGSGGSSSGTSPAGAGGTSGGTAGGGTGGTSPQAGAAGTGGNGRGKNKAAPLNTPTAVRQLLRSYGPRGKDMNKLATLAAEMKALNVEKTPHAFCFLIRSVFEIAGKQYAKANGIPLDKQTPQGPKEKKLATLLDECRKDLTKGMKSHDPYCRSLHGALVELGKADGILSIDSLAQLIHHPRFSVKVDDLCVTFSNIFPLLKELTK